jgi:YfiH family protein
MWSIEDSPFGRIVVAPEVPPGHAVFYTTRDFDGRLHDGVAARIGAFTRERFGIDAALTTCLQVHGVAARRATLNVATRDATGGGTTSSKTWRECDSCDALWTDERNVALGIKVADCLPVAMIDPEHGVAANIHSGWRGTAQRITDATIDAIESSTTFEGALATAWLGPSIRACCFEVGEEVVRAFEESYGDIASYVDRSRARPHIDLPALTADVLLQHGFRGDRIFDSELCTRCDGSIFHSFRRDGKTGQRNLAFVVQ